MDKIKINGVVVNGKEIENTERETEIDTEIIIDGIKSELASLDIVVPRVVEDLIASTGYVPHPSKQEVINRKNYLRQLLRDFEN